MANGIYTNTELVETLIVDLNNLVKEQINGQYINACGIIHQMAQKLINLRTGIKADLDGKDRKIEDLKESIRNLGGNIEEISPEEFIKEYEKKDGASNG